jgi:predicted Rossmann-fold nucleotide-binding protein
MRSVQPPITSEEEYRGYQQGRDTLTTVVREREQRLIEALKSGDETLIEARRYELLHVLADRQGIIDAIKTYEQRMAQSA